MSRRLPHFNRESLEVELPKHGIRVRWMKELGGRRKKIPQDSPNTGLRNDSFRNYADYMLTPEFEQGMARLLELRRSGTNTGNHVRGARVFPMPPYAGERLPRDARPHRVAHRRWKRPPRSHKLMTEAHMVKGKLLYNAQELF